MDRLLPLSMLSVDACHSCECKSQQIFLRMGEVHILTGGEQRLFKCILNAGMQCEIALHYQSHPW